jgi:hypothetical protein
MARFFKFAALGLLPLATALPSSAELGISFESGNEDAPLLKLDYGTYRGNYNSTAGVSVSCGLPTSKRVLTRTSVLGCRIQEHSLRGTAGGRTAMGETGAADCFYASA